MAPPDSATMEQEREPAPRSHAPSHKIIALPVTSRDWVWRPFKLKQAATIVEAVRASSNLKPRLAVLPISSLLEPAYEESTIATQTPAALPTSHLSFSLIHNFLLKNKKQREKPCRRVFRLPSHHENTSNAEKTQAANGPGFVSGSNNRNKTTRKNNAGQKQRQPALSLMNMQNKCWTYSQPPGQPAPLSRPKSRPNLIQSSFKSRQIASKSYQITSKARQNNIKVTTKSRQNHIKTSKSRPNLYKSVCLKSRQNTSKASKSHLNHVTAGSA